MSDPFDKDPDDVLEPDDGPETLEPDDPAAALEPDNPASRYGEETFDTTPEAPDAPGSETAVGVDYSDIDPGVRKLFWKLVIAVKFALLSLTLGTLFVVFGESTVFGGQLLAFGLVLTGYVAYQYRESKSRLESEEFEGVAEEDTDDGAPADGESDLESPAGGQS